MKEEKGRMVIGQPIVGFCQRYLIFPRTLINPNTEAQHKINKQAYGGLFHQIVQSNPLLAHKYTP
jgi:hypothetical protein